jgi:hypothetical protein
VYLPEAERERSALPENEIAAMINADAKLQALGPSLGYPHSSAVRGNPDCASCDLAVVAAAGEGFTNESATASSLRRSGLKRRWTSAASDAPVKRRRIDYQSSRKVEDRW